jgi:hypothetical protein
MCKIAIESTGLRSHRGGPKLGNRIGTAAKQIPSNDCMPASALRGRPGTREPETRTRQMTTGARVASRIVLAIGPRKPLVRLCPAERSSRVPKNVTCFIGYLRILCATETEICI